MFNKRISTLLILSFCLTIVFTSCDKEEKDNYTIPNSYTAFENVSYQGQTDRLNMMTEFKSYMAASRTSGFVLEADRMKAMFENDADNAGFTTTYTKQIKSKTIESEQAAFDALIDELAEASKSTVVGTETQSGVIESNDGAKSYLIGADGLDHAQLIEKGLMGACFYYQMTAVYMGDEKMNVDNEIVEVGEGTAMQHHWDEAFGYFGVAQSFPADLDNLKFWGDYSNKRNELLNCNQALMNAFLKGRAAIDNDDFVSRDEAITEARKILEEISVGSALHYLNNSITSFDDVAIRAHGLSEAIGFIYALKFNPNKKVDNITINSYLARLAGSADFSEMNLYAVTPQILESLRDDLAADYGFADQKAEF